MISKILMWGGGGLAAFLGLSWLAKRGAENNADAAQQQAAQPSLPIFVSSGGFGGGFGGGGLGGGSGVMPALPQSEFPAIPASTFNFPEIPGTNEHDVAIADYNFRAKQAAFKHEQDLAKWTFDILNLGVDDLIVLDSGWGGSGSRRPTPSPPDKSDFRNVTPQPVSGRTGDVGSVIGSGETSGGRVSSGRGGAVAGGSLSTGSTGRGGSGIDANTVRNLFQTMSSNQAEYELYRRAQQAGADNRQIADVLNKSGIAPTRVFSALDVENWKYERGL